MLIHQRYSVHKTLVNTFLIATQASDIFAYHIMKRPGYMVIRTEEISYLVKCIKVSLHLSALQ